MDNIEVSVVMPCLNEERGIGLCIRKIKEVFAKERLSGEIIVADNGSTDRSKAICLEAGAKVFDEPVPGYGSAYLRGLKEARGRYIIIADSDNTYDFYDIPKFVAELKKGSDFVMGSRFKGKMKKGAMTWSHRYIGNPIISFVFRVFFHSKISDALCGMRGFTREAYLKLNLRTLGMEFATEMIVAALQNNLKISEVALDYHPREGVSKLRSIPDAWRYIRFMLLYCPAWLYFIPGAIGFGVGMFIQVLLLRGPFSLWGHQWDVHPAVFASVLTLLSYQVIHLGIYAHTFGVDQGFLKEDRFTLFLHRHFNLEKWLLAGFLIFCAGIAINIFIFAEWISHSFGALFRIRESVFAMTLLVIGVQTIFSSFFISLLFMKRR